jgi:hypothetical protein
LFALERPARVANLAGKSGSGGQFAQFGRTPPRKRRRSLRGFDFGIYD